MLKTVNVQFTAEVYEFTEENIGRFITPAFARTRNSSHIKRLKDFLRTNGYQFGSAITVVKIGSGKFLVIDGNHRIEAFKEILDSNTIKSIYSVLIEYPTMTQESMKDFMRALGLNIKRQNLDSLFEVYEKNIFLYQERERLSTKVSIRNKKGYFKLINLINILEVKDSSKMPLQKSANSTLDRALATNEKDLEFINDFFCFFSEVFGRIEGDNRYAVSTFMIPLASIYGVNYDSLMKDLSDSKKRFQNLIQDPEILDLLAIGGKSRQILHAMRDRQIRVLNRKLLKNKESFE